MLSTLANTAIHRFNAMSSSMTKAITIKTHSFTTACSFVTLSITSPTSRSLSVVIQMNLKFSKSQVTRDCLRHSHAVMTQTIEDSMMSAKSATPVPRNFTMRAELVNNCRVRQFVGRVINCQKGQRKFIIICCKMSLMAHKRALLEESSTQIR